MELAETLARHGSAFLDATICGASSQLKTREAVFMVGGQTEGLPRAGPTLLRRGGLHNFVNQFGFSQAGNPGNFQFFGNHE